MGIRQSKDLTVILNGEKKTIKLHRDWILFCIPEDNPGVYLHKQTMVKKIDGFEDWLDNNMCCICRSDNYANSYYFTDETGKRMDYLMYSNTHRAQTYNVIPYTNCSHLFNKVNEDECNDF